MKTIIQVWTHNVTNYKPTQYHARWGLGDIVRGTIALYQLCKKHNYKFICDIQLHPISSHLQTHVHEHKEFVLHNKDNICFFANNALEKHIVTSKEDVVLLMTNAYIKGPITEDCINFVKLVLQPKDHLQQYINKTLEELPFYPYSIMHYRVAGISGDQIQTHGKKDINRLLNHIKKNKEECDILMTDCIQLKSSAKTEIISLNTKIAHLGFHVKDDYIKDTLLDFFIMSKASKIKYHPSNGPSGFIRIINQIYGVPLVKM
jgi:hypothetical protein